MRDEKYKNDPLAQEFFVEADSQHQQSSQYQDDPLAREFFVEANPVEDQDSPGRALARGAKNLVAGAVGAIPNAAGFLLNNALSALNSLAGTDIPSMPDQAGVVSDAIDHVTGGYTASTPTSGPYDKANEFVGSLAAPGAAVAKLGGNLTSKGRKLLEFIGSTEPAVLAGGGAAGYAGEKLAEGGTSTLGQVGGSVGAGVLTSLATRKAGNVSRALLGGEKLGDAIRGPSPLLSRFKPEAYEAAKNAGLEANPALVSDNFVTHGVDKKIDTINSILNKKTWSEKAESDIGKKLNQLANSINAKNPNLNYKRALEGAEKMDRRSLDSLIGSLAKSSDDPTAYYAKAEELNKQKIDPIAYERIKASLEDIIKGIRKSDATTPRIKNARSKIEEAIKSLPKEANEMTFERLLNTKRDFAELIDYDKIKMEYDDKILNQARKVYADAFEEEAFKNNKQAYIQEKLADSIYANVSKKKEFLKMIEPTIDSRTGSANSISLFDIAQKDEFKHFVEKTLSDESKGKLDYILDYSKELGKYKNNKHGAKLSGSTLHGLGAGFALGANSSALKGLLAFPVPLALYKFLTSDAAIEAAYRASKNPTTKNNNILKDTLRTQGIQVLNNSRKDDE